MADSSQRQSASTALESIYDIILERPWRYTDAEIAEIGCQSAVETCRE